MKNQYTSPDIQSVEDALQYIDSSDRDTWIRVGLGIKKEFGETGFDVWNNWSQTAGNYNEKSAKNAWKSFKGSIKVNINTVFFLARQNGYTTPSNHSGYKPKTSPSSKEELAAQRVKLTHNEAAKKEAIAQRLQTRFDNLSDTPPHGTNPYLERKGVGNFGVKFDKHNNLVIPVSDIEGKVRSLQTIMPNRTVLEIPEKEIPNAIKAGAKHYQKGDINYWYAEEKKKDR